MHHAFIICIIYIYSSTAQQTAACVLRVLVEAVGILMRDLCMQLEPVGLRVDENTLCTQTLPSICSDPATRRGQDGAGLKEGGAVGLKSGGGESQTWFKAAIRWSRWHGLVHALVLTIQQNKWAIDCGFNGIF